MKRMIALLLCLCFALGGCAQGETEYHTENGGAKPEPSPAPIAAESFEALALGLAAVPDLPEEPDENAFWEQTAALDFDALGESKYNEAYDKLWNEFSAKRDAYYEAVDALRGEGVDPALTGAFASYTLRTARQLMENETEKNVVWSPANLYLALCMLAETADGESRAQLLELLGLSDVEQARKAANSLFRNLYRDGADGRTLLANSIWMGEQVGFKQDTVDRLTNDYFASAFRAKMGEGATDEAIHAWINENTNHLLENAAGGIQTDADTLMLLISTLYFKGTWADQFSEGATSEDTFTSASGAEQKINFMHTSKNGTYYRGENFTVASLPFTDGTAMWFLLPDEGVSADELWPKVQGLPMTAVTTTEGCYEAPAFDLLAQEGYGEIHWSVPKFDVDSDLDLIPALKALGVTDVFTDSADFSPLTDVDALLSAVKHAARVKVDEEGCEAAAFTSMMVGATSAMPETLPVVEMDLNRPFGFLITGADGLPLFVSIVNTVE